MKKSTLFVVTGLLMGALMIFFMSRCGGDAGESIKPAEKSSFYEVTSQLNKGGNFYLYLSTEKFIKVVDDFAVNLRAILEKEMAGSGDTETQGLKIFDFIYGLVKKSGMMEISGVGISSIPIEQGLTHSRFVVHHYKDKGTGLIWQMAENTPRDLAELKLLPADTVMAGYGEFKINVLWEWFKKEATASDLPELKQGVLSVEPLLQTQGIDLNKLLDSIDGMGYIITLDSTNMKTLPMGSAMIQIPDPAIAIMFSVKDDYVFNLLQSKMPPAQQPGEKDVKKIQIPVPPMPVTVEPVILQKDGLLVFASNNRIADAMFAAKEKENGLIAGDEFKKLSPHVPTKGNGFRFVSSRFFGTILDVQKKVMQASASGDVNKGDDAAFKLFSTIFPKELAVFSVTRHTGEGVITIVNHTMGFEQMVLMTVTAPLGIVAAIAIPNMLTAIQKGKQKATMGDMKTIGTAIESYITDTYEAPPGNSLEEIKAKLEPFYIQKLPLKDAWGNDFHYKHGTGNKKDEYFIGSGGKDGVFDGWDQTGFYIVATMNGFNNDFIYANGQFVFGPKVK
jgi:type II secretory pathway pseudopilin PulG